jgi:hypothetical protein
MEVDNKVKVKNIGCSRDGKIGKVVKIFPSGMFESFTIFIVNFGNNQLGQFKEEELEVII